MACKLGAAVPHPSAGFLVIHGLQIKAGRILPSLGVIGTAGAATVGYDSVEFHGLRSFKICDDMSLANRRASDSVATYPIPSKFHLPL